MVPGKAPGKPWLTKAQQKQLGLLDRPDSLSDIEDMSYRDKWDERDFLSNDEEEEVASTDKIIRFFNGKDYQSFLCKRLLALNLES